MRTLVAQPLGDVAFAPFGEVIAGACGGQAINGGTARRHEAVADLDLVRAHGRAVLAVYDAQARHFPFDALELERHALSDQVFLPLGAAQRCVILVAPPGERPLAAHCRAFLGDGSQGVRLRAGTWHHPLLALQDGRWAVLERRARDATPDCEVHRLDEALRLVLPG